jgi:hypothetical protein
VVLRGLVRAARELVCLQTADLTEAMRADRSGGDETVLRVDGGTLAGDWTLSALPTYLPRPSTGPVALEMNRSRRGMACGAPRDGSRSVLDFDQNAGTDDSLKCRGSRRGAGMSMIQVVVGRAKRLAQRMTVTTATLGRRSSLVRRTRNGPRFAGLHGLRKRTRM